MTVQMRRRHLIASQKKKNWFDFSKVKGGADYYYTYKNYFARVEGDMYIANYGSYATGVWLYDSSTTLPKGKYVLSFTAYAPTAFGLDCGVSKMQSNLNGATIARIYDYSLKSKIHTDYSMPFSLDEETIVVLFLKGIGNSSNFLNLQYEFTNIRIEKVG